MKNGTYRLVFKHIDNDKIEREQNLKRDDELYKAEINTLNVVEVNKDYAQCVSEEW